MLPPPAAAATALADLEPAGLPAGQARARSSQVRAAIVDTEWQVRANTVWNRYIRSQLPVTAVAPPLAAPWRGGGSPPQVRRRGEAGRCWGVWGVGCDARPMGACVHVGLYE
jgi:hypothetical protein